VEEDDTPVKSLYVNEKEWACFFVCREGKKVDPLQPFGKGTYDITLDYAWKSGETYRVRIDFEKGEQVKFLGTAPLKGGIPKGQEGFYRIFRTEERVGLERRGEIVSATLTAPKRALENGGFALFDGMARIPYQLLDMKESVPHDKAAGNHPIARTYKIAFPVDLSPFEKKTILVLMGDGPDHGQEGFTCTGDGIGRTIKNSKVSLALHPQSGQINTLEYLEDSVKLYNEAGVIHWNPGCFIPGVAWDHSFNWNPPPSFEEIKGSFLYVLSRRGPLQKIKGVNLEVRYKLERDSPWFISETRMTMEEDLGVIALRNDEMVFYKDLFDSFIYRDKGNRLVELPLKEKDGFPFGGVHIAPDDLDWVGLLNKNRGYGFFGLRIEYVNSFLGSSGNWLHKPGTYFYAPSDGNYVYWVRPLLYTWSEYTTSNHLTFVPKGSSFYEKNAYLLLRLDEDFAKKLDVLLKRLRNPIRVF
jgi:hypothetical protein